jgi:hypothetical protein
MTGTRWLFVLYLAMIVLGLAYVIALGVLGR